MEQTDEAVAVQVQQGNSEAFALLLARYESKLLRYAGKFLFYDPEGAEDVIQDVFLKAYTQIQSFDPARKFSSWLYRIAHNELINTIRKQRREHVSFFDLDTVLPHLASGDATDAAAKASEERAALEGALQKLDAKYREPLILYYFEDLDYQAIADVLRIPVSTVGVRLRRARQAMQAHLHPPSV